MSFGVCDKCSAGLEMVIPKNFTIFGQQFTVEFDPELHNREDYVGQHRPRQNKIVLSPAGPNMPVTRMEETFIHEIVHAVLSLLSEEELDGKEKFVDTFALALHQVIKTAEGTAT